LLDPRNVLIWSRGSREEGLGHIVRGISIAKFFRKKFNNITLIFESDIETRSKIKKKDSISHLNCKFVELDTHPEMFLDQTHLCFVDRFIYDKSIFRVIKKFTDKVIVFDELQQIDFLDFFSKNDIVIRSQLLLNQKLVSKNQHSCKLLSGLDYFVINKIENSQKNYRHLRKIDILVMLGGGAGYESFYVEIAKILKKFLKNFPNIVFILGDSYCDYLSNKIRSLDERFHTFGFVDSPMSFMKNSNMGIMSGGYSKYESAYVGLPSLILPVQEHQIGIAKAFCNNGGGIYIANTRALEKVILDLLDDSERLDAISASSKNLIDGKALNRIERLL